MQPSSILWQPIRNRAVTIQNRTTVKQQLALLQRNIGVDLAKAGGAQPRRLYRVRC